jgi:hypothetical protein
LLSYTLIWSKNKICNFTSFNSAIIINMTGNVEILIYLYSDFQRLFISVFFCVCFVWARFVQLFIGIIPLQQQKTELENVSEMLNNTEKERSRLSSENGNSVLKVIYHFDDKNVFECAF